MEMNGNLFSRYHNTDTLIRSFLFLIFPALIPKSLMAEPYQYFCFNVSIWHFLSSQILRKKQIRWERFKGIRAPSGTTIQAATLIFFQLECSAKKYLFPPPPQLPKKESRVLGGILKENNLLQKTRKNKRISLPPKKMKISNEFSRKSDSIDLLDYLFDPQGMDGWAGGRKMVILWCVLGWKRWQLLQL